MRLGCIQGSGGPLVTNHLCVQTPRLGVFCLTLLVDEAEVRNGNVMICKTIKKYNKKREWHKSKESSNTDTKEEKSVHNVLK